MFFSSRAQGLAEMWRVLKPGGTLLVAGCDAVHRSPGYAVFAELLQDLFGAEVAESFRAPFSAGNADQLHLILQEAGVTEAHINQQQGSETVVIMLTHKIWIGVIGSAMPDASATIMVASSPALVGSVQLMTFLMLS
jgi:ubiquinone/menaquinone biosynthesis C-methylase UbiE